MTIHLRVYKSKIAPAPNVRVLGVFLDTFFAGFQAGFLSLFAIWACMSAPSKARP